MSDLTLLRRPDAKSITWIAGVLEDTAVYLVAFVAVLFMMLGNPPAWYGIAVALLTLTATLSLLTGWLARQQRAERNQAPGWDVVALPDEGR